LWDPRLGHSERYTRAAETMPSLDPAIIERATTDALKITSALGYDMNTVELAINGETPYAIDYMNSAPDFDITSLGEEHFAWVVKKMAELVIDLAKERPRADYRWDALLRAR
jgi:hypothetical protein